MKRILFGIIIVLALLAGSGCGRERAVSGVLDRVGSLLEVAPDSAMALLVEVDSAARECGDEIQARYAALMSFCHYKLYINAPDTDSLAAAAAAFFAGQRDHSIEKMHSLFMLADAQSSDGQYARSIITASKAEKEALALGDYRSLGRIYRLICTNYRAIFDRNAEIDYARKSVEAFEHQSGRAYTLNAYFEYGISAYNMRDYNESRMVADSVAREAYAANDMGLYLEALHLSGVSACRQEDYESTISTLEKLLAMEDYRPISSDIECLGHAYINQGNLKRAKELSVKYQGIGNNMPFLDYSINLEEKDYKNALESQLKRMQFNDSLFRVMALQNMAEMLTDNFLVEQSLLEEEHSNERKNLWLFIGGLLFLLLLLIVVSIYLIHRRKQREESMLSLVENLKSLQLNTDEKSVSLKNTMSEIFGEWMPMIDKMLGYYYTHEGVKKERAESEAFFKDMVNSLASNSPQIHRIEELADSNNDSIMSTLRGDFPDLNANDYRLFLFLVLGFSLESICLLLQSDKKSIYNRRYRLQQRIQNSDSASRERYLAVLNPKRSAPELKK